MTEADMFLRPAVCRSCGTFVLDEKAHQDFHDAVQAAFKAQTDAMQRVFVKAGIARKGSHSVRPDRTGRSEPGTACRSCGGVLVEVQAEIPVRRSDSTVPFLVCLGCMREIRRG